MAVPAYPQMTFLPQVPKPKPPEPVRHVMPNPDDDGREEKYVSGNWKSRILLALQSGLPNEADWAFNKLIKLSFSHNFYQGIVPGILDALLDHASPFFDSLTLHISKSDFETLPKKPQYESNPDPIVSPITEISLFNTKKSGESLERALQVLHILRNMSFVPENASEFAGDYRLLHFLAKGMAVPGATFYVEVKHYVLEIFENIAGYYLIRTPKDFYLACLKRLLGGRDRAVVLSCVRSLTKLGGVEANADVLGKGVDDELVRRMLQLLLVPDEGI
ncbi:Chromatin structure-remodeling complex protein rsc9, partial [Rhizophlyctis rosea]